MHGSVEVSPFFLFANDNHPSVLQYRGILDDISAVGAYVVPSSIGLRLT